MSRRERWVFTAMQVLTVVVVVGLLIWSIIESQAVATQRAEVAQQAALHNRRQIEQLDRIVRDIRAAQVNQRQAFKALAERNEELHGRDPAGAPRFNALPSETPKQRQPDGTQRDRPDDPEPDEPEDEPEDDPETVPPPDQPDKICVPVIDVCL